MAIVRALNQVAWAEWVASRPPGIQTMCEKWPPDRLYRMEPTGQRVLLHSYEEDGTVTVDILGTFNALVCERRVFGIDPASLTECDLPTDNEVVGALLT
jgi:hypothetical protein